jgi:hypothetical protein
MSGTEIENQTPDDEDAQQASDEAMLDRHLAVLIEHFEAVQIFVTRPVRGEEGTSAMLSRGKGNFYTRRGMVDDWAERNRGNNYREAD